MRLLLLLIVMLAGCALAPSQPGPVSCGPGGICPACPQCPPAKPAAEAARYQEAPFDALPGWAGAALQPSLRVFLTGCLRQGPLPRACGLGRARSPDDEGGGGAVL